MDKLRFSISVLDCGEAAAEWIQLASGISGVRLVRHQSVRTGRKAGQHTSSIIQF